METTVVGGTNGSGSGLRGGALGVRHVVFFVIAAAAPLGYAVGQMPLAIGRGGVGAAGMFVVIGIILAVFAVGFVAMAKFIPRVGGMYLFVLEGLGRPMGIATAFLALVAYATASTGVIGVFAVFAQFSASDLFGWDSSPWQLWAFVAVVLMGVLGVCGVELNARVLGVVLLAETAILVLVAVVIALKGGSESGLTATAFKPSEIFGVSPGAALALTGTAFAGFEATVLFVEEVRGGTRTIVRATFLAIAIMVLTYAFVCWAFIQAFGDEQATAIANADPTNMFFIATESYVGAWAVKIMAVLVVSSWFASILAFHNATSRYLFALGRDRVLPSYLGRSHARLKSPANASVTHTVFSVIVLILFMFTGGDPYLDLLVLGAAPAVVGLPVMELITSIAVFAFFMRNRRGFSVWQVLVCPALAAVALAVVVSVIFDQMELLTARTGFWNIFIICVIFAALGSGYIRALWLRRRQPEVYDQLAQKHDVHDLTPSSER